MERRVRHRRSQPKWRLSGHRDVRGAVDALHPSDHFIDLVSQHVRPCDRLVPDWVLPCLAIETAFAVDVDVELESDAAIEAHEDHAVRYRSSLDLGASDRLESCEHFVKDVHSDTSRR